MQDDRRKVKKVGGEIRQKKRMIRKERDSQNTRNNLSHRPSQRREERAPVPPRPPKRKGIERTLSRERTAHLRFEYARGGNPSFFSSGVQFLKTKFVSRFFLFLLFLATLFWLLQQSWHANVTYHQKAEDLTLAENVTLSRAGGDRGIPFGILELEDFLEREIPITQWREEEGYAEGKIRIYNEYSSSPQRLLPHTRFESASGKIFLSGDEETIIPGMKDGKAGTVDIIVRAQEKGPAYNIDLTDFVIPGFKEAGLDEKYEKVYAVSREAFHGGEVRKVPVMGEKEKRSHEKLLEQELQERLVQKLFSEKTDELRIIEKGVQILFANPEWEQEGEKMKLKLKGTLRALIVREDAFRNYLTRVLGKLARSVEKGQTFTVTPESFEKVLVLYEGDQKKNFAKLTKIPVRIEGEARIVWDLDEAELLRALAGKEVSELPSLFSPFPSLAAISASIVPFWKKVIPLEYRDIHLERGEPYLIQKGE